MDYKPLLIAVGTNDLRNTSYMQYDTLEQWNCYVKSVPFNLFPKPKNISSQKWNDEDGDDEYIPTEIKYEAYEMKIDFVYLGTDANTDIYNFLNTITGKWLKIYDNYTGIGRQSVRLVSVEDKATLYRQ